MQPDASMGNIWIPYVMIFGIFLFLVILPERKRRKQTKEMLANLKKNDEVVTSSGIHGTVVIVKDKTIVIRVDEGCRIEFDRDAVVTVVNTTIKPEVVK